jgi:hypothetical protein
LGRIEALRRQAGDQSDRLGPVMAEVSAQKRDLLYEGEADGFGGGRS